MRVRIERLPSGSVVLSQGTQMFLVMPDDLRGLAVELTRAADDSEDGAA